MISLNKNIREIIKMKNHACLFFVLLISANSLFSATADTGVSKNNLGSEFSSIEQIKHKIETGETFSKLSPFGLRVFNSFLDGKWIGNAISYGAYRNGQEPGKIGPNEDEVFEDLSIISKHWNLIRVYSADNISELILQVIKKHKFRTKVMLGLWLENEVNNSSINLANMQQVLRGIELANKFPELVSAVSVGNETQVFWSGHRMSSESLVRYIRIVRENITQPVTTADDYNFWNKPESKIVADEIDFIVAHYYPLWNGKSIDQSIEDINKVFFNEVKKLYPDKLVVFGETGWATNYNAAKTGPGEQGTLVRGEVSVNAQEKFLILIHDWIEKNKVITFLFEVFDEPWKGGGVNSPANEIEKHWGVFYENRSPKESFLNYLKYLSSNEVNSNLIPDGVRK